MPAPALILGGAQVVSSLYGGIKGRSSAKKAAKATKRIGRMRAAELTRQAEEEDKFRIEEKQAELDAYKHRMEQVSGMYSKSGVLMTGTPAMAMEKQREADIYALEQGDEAAQERARRLREAAKIELEEAAAAASGYQSRGTADLISGVVGAVQGGAQMWGPIKNWMGSQNDPLAGVKPPQQFDPRQNYLLEGWQP